jgi:hypothetical protein
MLVFRYGFRDTLRGSAGPSLDANLVPMNEQLISPESLINQRLLNNHGECAQQQCLSDPMKTLIAPAPGASAVA